MTLKWYKVYFNDRDKFFITNLTFYETVKFKKALGKEMDVTEKQQTLLRMLPGGDNILELAKADPFFNDIPKSVLVRSIRTVVENLRTIIIDDKQDITQLTHLMPAYSDSCCI